MVLVRQRRVRSVLEAVRPTTSSEVRRLLGMVGLSARFIPDFATTAEPIQVIARKATPFTRCRDQVTAFKELMHQLATTSVLAYFDRDAHTRVVADASLVGLGAVLVQDINGVS